jgi:hypothetical protein
MRKNFMLLVVVLACLLASSLTAFAGSLVLTGARFVGNCSTISIQSGGMGGTYTVSVVVNGVTYGTGSASNNSTTTLTLNRPLEGTNTVRFVSSGVTVFTTVMSCTSFRPPATEDGRENVYAPMPIAVYEQVSKLGCDFIIIAIDPQGEYHNFVISQALRDEATEVPANGLLLDGDDYVQVYKLSDGTFQVNSGPYNNAGDIYVLNLNGCPSTIASDANSTYRNRGE